MGRGCPKFHVLEYNYSVYAGQRGANFGFRYATFNNSKIWDIESRRQGARGGKWAGFGEIRALYWGGKRERSAVSAVDGLKVAGGYLNKGAKLRPAFGKCTEKGTWEVW